MIESSQQKPQLYLICTKDFKNQTVYLKIKKDREKNKNLLQTQKLRSLYLMDQWHIEQQSDNSSYVKIYNDYDRNKNYIKLVINENVYASYNSNNIKMKAQVLCDWQKDNNESDLWEIVAGPDFKYMFKSAMKIQGKDYYFKAKDLFKDLCLTNQEDPNNFWEIRPILQQYQQYQQTSDQHLKFSLPQAVKFQTFDHQKIVQKIAFFQKSRITNFKGQIYSEQDFLYNRKTKQYASYYNDGPKFHPFLICYPLNTNDILAAISYAKQKGKYIVARSGGHQYTGKSSGGKDTIVLSMENFDKNGKNQINGDLFDVEPGVKLTKINSRLTDLGLSIPHGQCPLVCIGGHAQTGGYGHFFRSFGLNGDYVQGFEIVTANQQVLQITRPNSKLLPKSQYIDQNLNNQIFRSVLSGNAGSFGIVTKYIYKTIKDEDHPYSWHYKNNKKYEKDLFKNLLYQVQKWTKLIKTGQDAQKLKGLDFMMTVCGWKIGSFLDKNIMFNRILVELVYADLDKKPYANQFDQIIGIVQKQAQNQKQSKFNIFSSSSKGNLPLSHIARKFVRHQPQVTALGRQFNLPYKKRANVTMDELSNEFITQFSNLMEKTINTKGLNVIFQMVLGGGQFRNKGKQTFVLKGSDGIGKKLSVTGYPFRDCTYNLVYDIFYQPKQIKIAQDFQNQMQTIVDKYYNGDKQRRLFWATFNDTNINDAKIRNMYYDNEQQYKQLQEVKTKIDKNDLFHTDLTVKPKQIQ